MAQILWSTQILCWMPLMQNVQNRQQQRLTLCLKSLRQSLKCRLGISTCKKHWAKNYSFHAGNIFKLSSLNKKERQEAAHRYLSWWLRTSYWQRDWTQNCISWGDTKTNQRQRKVVSRSFYVSSGVAFSGNNDLRKILLFCESFRLRQMRW